MLIVLRKSLVAFLMLLQLLAPLVHAHVGQSSSNFGIHLPELETFNRTSQQVFFQASDALTSMNALAVGIHTGMQHKQIKEIQRADHNPHCVALFISAVIPKQKSALFAIDCFVQSGAIADDSIVILLRAPRAPPAV